MAGATRRSGLRRIDWLLILSAVILMAYGFAALYSVGLRIGDNVFKKQFVMAILGLGPFALFFFVDPKWWRKAAWYLYGFNLLVLTAVLFVGSTANGAQRWIDLKFMQFQPSEMAKILTVVTLAAFLAARQSSIAKLSTFALSFVHVAVPALLIAKQPHYGGAMVLLVIWLCVCIAGNVPMKYVVAAILLLAGGAVASTQIPGFLHDYHLKRLQAMEQEDKSGASYQQDRALVAFGMGGLGGDGFRRGRQTLPEQQNDFIFTVVGEELGLVGTTLALFAYGFFFYRIWLVMLFAAEPYYRMLAAGVLGMLAFHTIVNLGMVLQILPVVGLWLPFMSAGGTALWLCMACVGLLLKVRAKEKPLLF
ncbi:MAG TPA: FtsW/RodA/SpoVE family cell cycle protein [Fimbriimonadaceae bacterium]|nr:FtsW/RodA/SpoVE family cell cycle protein [Fimbriimonadaceae bacterium]